MSKKVLRLSFRLPEDEVKYIDNQGMEDRTANLLKILCEHRGSSETEKPPLPRGTESGVGSPLPASHALSEEKAEQGSPLSASSDISEPFDYQCPYLTLLKDGNILCMETLKMPLEACLTRRKRYQAMNRRCTPPQLKKKRWFPSERYPKKENQAYMPSRTYEWNCPQGKTPNTCSNSQCNLKADCQNLRDYKRSIQPY